MGTVHVMVWGKLERGWSSGACGGEHSVAWVLGHTRHGLQACADAFEVKPGARPAASRIDRRELSGLPVMACAAGRTVHDFCDGLYSVHL